MAAPFYLYNRFIISDYTITDRISCVLTCCVASYCCLTSWSQLAAVLSLALSLALCWQVLLQTFWLQPLVP